MLKPRLTSEQKAVKYACDRMMIAKALPLRQQGKGYVEIERANIYRKLRDYAQNLYDRRFRSGNDSGSIVMAHDYKSSWRASNQLAHINKLRVYKRRNEELIAFITEYK